MEISFDVSETFGTQPGRYRLVPSDVVDAPKRSVVDLVSRIA
jgi:hypothetical protein